MGIGLINVCLCVGTLNLTEIVIAQLAIWLFFLFFPVGIMLYSTVQTVQHSTVQYSTAQHSTVQYSTVSLLYLYLYLWYEWVAGAVKIIMLQ